MNSQRIYIKVGITEADKALLLDLIDRGKATSLSSAAHYLAFERRPVDYRIICLESTLVEISALHQDLTKLIYAQMENKSLYEPDLIRMERMVSTFGKEIARLSKFIRREDILWAP